MTITAATPVETKAPPIAMRKCVHNSGEASVVITFNDGFGSTDWRMCDKCCLSIKRAIDSRSKAAWKRPWFRFTEWLYWLGS